MKPKLLLLHGALGTSKQFKRTKQLLLHQFELYELDFEGHGGRSSNQAYSIDLFTQNVIDFLNQENINQINVFGYSMGGYVALNTAFQYPKRIDKITTLGTKFDWNSETAAKEAKMLNPEKIEEKVPKFASRLKELHEPLDWKIVLEKTGQMMLNLGEGIGCALNDFTKLQHSVTIGIGDKDTMVNFDESEQVANSLQNGKLIQLEGVPHPIDLIDPEKIATYIQDSLK